MNPTPRQGLSGLFKLSRLWREASSESLVVQRPWSAARGAQKTKHYRIKLLSKMASVLNTINRSLSANGKTLTPKGGIFIENQFVMKYLLLGLLLCLPNLSLAQRELSMSEVTSKRELPMSATYGNSDSGMYRYYAKGEKEPFTGSLFGRYENGQLSSWQEYVDGLGQGRWINYYENGNKKEEGTYNQNRVEGPIKKYNQDGTLAAVGTYKNWRIRTGEWTFYKTDGTIDYLKDYGDKGSIEEVKQYYKRGEIPYSWYASILKENGFSLE